MVCEGIVCDLKYIIESINHSSGTFRGVSLRQVHISRNINFPSGMFNGDGEIVLTKFIIFEFVSVLTSTLSVL